MVFPFIRTKLPRFTIYPCRKSSQEARGPYTCSLNEEQWPK